MVCADFGGVALSGGPCRRRVIDSRCPDHTERAEEAKKAIKKTCLELLGDGQYLSQVAAAVKMSPIQLWRWRKEDPAFDQAVAALTIENDERRTVVVEETMYQRIVDGKAHPAETIFWLKNRAPGRWRDKREQVLTGSLEHKLLLARLLGVDPVAVPEPPQQLHRQRAPDVREV